MKVFFTALCALALSGSAHAVSTLGYDLRADYQFVNYNDAANFPAYQRFYLKTGRLYFKGNLNERISYEVRWAFSKPAVETTPIANAGRDSLNSSVEYANVTDKMSDMFALTVGKFNTEMGGFEGATSGSDLYLVTPNYGHQAALTLTGKNLGINQSGANNLLYATGIKGDFTTNDQHIYILATNNQGDAQDANNKFNQNRGILGMTWKATFAEKTWGALISYHEVSPQAQVVATDPGNKHSFISVGAKYEKDDYFGMLDYSTTEYKDGLSGSKDTLWSALFKLGYKIDQWTPRLEVYTAEESVGIGATTGKNKFMGYGAVLEYKPTADNFRYHVAYNSVTTKPIAGNDLMKSEIVVGARLFGDFLK